jgi:hypothetical protein
MPAITRGPRSWTWPGTWPACGSSTPAAADLHLADVGSPLPFTDGAFTTAGFRIAVISEPAPAPAARELFPAELTARPRFLCFIFFVLEAV